MGKRTNELCLYTLYALLKMVEGAISQMRCYANYNKDWKFIRKNKQTKND